MCHDNEKGLTGGEFKDYCEHMNITQITGLANQGQMNGRIESQVRNAKNALRTLTTSQDSKANWPDELWKVQLKLNMEVSSTTNMSQEMLLFGHKITNKFKDLIQINLWYKTEKFENHNKRPLDIRQMIIDEAANGRKNQLARRNKKLTICKYKINDLVYRQILQPTTAGTRHALDQRYVGPFRIRELFDSSAIITTNMAKLCGQAHVHLDQLKPFHEGRPQLSPAWSTIIEHRLKLIKQGSRPARENPAKDK